MTGGASPRWVMSFADLCLLLLGFFVLLYATAADPARVAAGLRQEFGGEPALPARDLIAAAWFEPGEAVLLPARRRELVALGRRAAAANQRIALSSRGVEPGSARFDGWELAAARTAAAARALKAGGLDEHRIEIALVRGDAAGQRLALVLQGGG